MLWMIVNTSQIEMSVRIVLCRLKISLEKNSDNMSKHVLGKKNLGNAGL